MLSKSPKLCLLLKLLYTLINFQKITIVNANMINKFILQMLIQFLINYLILMVMEKLQQKKLVTFFEIIWDNEEVRMKMKLLDIKIDSKKGHD